MAFFVLFLYSIIIVFIVCAFVSVIQFFIDLKRCSSLRSDLKELIERAKLVDEETAPAEGDSYGRSN